MNAERRVLIIDSDLKNCKAIKYALTEYGISAYYTLSVVDGIERLMRHGCQPVILDIFLSETDGLELLRFMRQMKDLPILVLSSQGGIKHKVRASRLGADNYMEKPLELRECLLRAQGCSDATIPPVPPCPVSGATPSLTLKICSSTHKPAAPDTTGGSWS